MINEDLLVLAFGVMLRAQANDGQDEVRILELGNAQPGPVKLAPATARPLSSA